MSEPSASGPRRRLTYADYAALPDDGHRYQLVEGELVVTPSPTSAHQIVVGAIYHRLCEHVDRQGSGHVFVAPLDVVLGDEVVLQPDVFYVARDRAGIIREANVRGAPDVCVEVLSPEAERVDRVRKFDLYARHGVGHYWLVDLVARAIEEYVLAGDVYRARGVTRAEDVFRPAALPGFEFRLASLELPRDDEGVAG